MMRLFVDLHLNLSPNDYATIDASTDAHGSELIAFPALFLSHVTAKGMRTYTALSRMFADGLRQGIIEIYMPVSLCGYHEHDVVTPNECHS